MVRAHRSHGSLLAVGHDMGVHGSEGMDLDRTRLAEFSTQRAEHGGLVLAFSARAFALWRKQFGVFLEVSRAWSHATTERTRERLEKIGSALGAYRMTTEKKHGHIFIPTKRIEAHRTLWHRLEIRNQPPRNQTRHESVNREMGSCAEWQTQ